VIKIIPLLFFWFLILLIEAGEAMYVVLRDFKTPIPNKASLYRKVIASLMATALIIGTGELYIFRHGLSTTVYSDTTFIDSGILISSNLLLFLTAGLLYSIYLNMVKTHKLDRP
jgi:hypothetical protein